MITKSKSATIFILDLLILYFSFFIVFVHYNGFVPVSLRAILMMLFVAVAWFIIAFNSSAANMHPDFKILSTLKNVVAAYSVLTVSVIMVVAVFADFAPNNKLILWPLFLGLCLSADNAVLCPCIRQTFVNTRVSTKERPFDWWRQDGGKR